MAIHEAEGDEYESHRPPNFSKGLAMHIKSFTGRLELAPTLNALIVVKNDIARSDMQANAQALQILKRVANTRAKELGFKTKHEDEKWWV